MTSDNTTADFYDRHHLHGRGALFLMPSNTHEDRTTPQAYCPPSPTILQDSLIAFKRLFDVIAPNEPKEFSTDPNDWIFTVTVEPRTAKA